MPKILANLDEFMSAVERTPFIDTSLLKHVYTTATDEQLWRTREVTLTLTELNQRRH